MNVFAFPFYDQTEKQSRFNSLCSKVNAFALYSPPNRFLPFMIKKPKDGQLVDCVKVYSTNDEILITTIPFESFTYKMYSDSAYDYIFYYGAIIEDLNLECGEYYLNVSGYWSEVFTVVDDVSRLLKIEWFHDSQVGEAIYQNGFYQRLYLDTILADPKYKIEQEGDENGEGEFVPTFTRVVKKYRLESLLLPEFLVDVLHSMAAHSHVTIGNLVDVQQIEADVDWLVSGSAATVELSFQEANSVFAKNCSDPLQLVEVDQAGYEIKPWLCGDPGYNNPYWQNTGEERCVTIENTPRTKAWRPVEPYCLTS
jgi:hypothetical protein